MAVWIELIEGADASAGLGIAARIIDLQVDVRREAFHRQAVAEDTSDHSSADVPVSDSAELPRCFNFVIKITSRNFAPCASAHCVSFLTAGSAIECCTAIVRAKPVKIKIARK